MHHPHLFRLIILGALVCAALLLLPRSAAFAAPAMAVYQGELAAATGPARRIELRLKADGTMSLMTDFRNNRAPVTESGRWIPLSLEQIDLVIERKDGAVVAPTTLHFLKQGDILRSTGQTSAQFGGKELELRQTKAAAAPPAALPGSRVADTAGQWRWEGLVSPAGRIEIDEPERYTLELQNGGKVLVRADCNRGQGLQKFDGRALSIKVTSMSKVTCATGSLSNRFVSLLESAATERIRGDNLFIDLAGEGGTMRFVRANK
jgi:heat shock protein HslJ